MNKKGALSLIFAVCSFAATAQEKAEHEIEAPEVKLSYLDSVKNTFIRHEVLSDIDSLWMKELANTELFDTMQEDIENVNPDEDVDFNLSSEVLKERLAKLDATSPFHIEYNPALENVIKSYLKRRTKSFERLMAISQYYFPMFEEYLDKYDLPIEIKYLAVVESALNPRARSRVGATGLWQFMYRTGKQYNLEVNSYVDERQDPLKATEAACQYLSAMYKIFGDWDLVLASYNAGPGNVTKAIRRSGDYKNYWNIRHKLPKETRGYVPAFMATMYVYEYAKEHGITPKQPHTTYFETDTVMVKREMSFAQISSLLDVPVEQIQFLNPIYKRDVVPYTTEKAHYIRLPKNKIGLFTSNENAIYAYIDHEFEKREKPHYIREQEEALALSEQMEGKKVIITTQSYRIKRGDNLGAIANKYGVSVKDIKNWNGLRGNMIRAGQRLHIKVKTIVDIPEEELVVEKPEPVAPVKTKEADVIPVTVEPEVQNIAINGMILDSKKEDTESEKDLVAAFKKDNNNAISYEQEHMYIVQKGDSLFSIAKKLPGVTVDHLKRWNKLNKNVIKPGMKLKVGEETN